MSIERFLMSKKLDILWVLLSLLVLFINFYYLYVNSYPVNFLFNPKWVVFRVYEDNTHSNSQDDGIRLGDQIVRIGNVCYDDFIKNIKLDIFSDLRGKRSVEIEVRREGKNLRFDVERRRSRWRWEEHAVFIAATTFWLLATLAIIFLRPRDERWLVLILLYFSCALWIASGYVSFTRIAFSSIVFHTLSWLFLPMSIHLHLILPEPLTKRSMKIPLVIIYGTAILAFAALRLPGITISRGLELLIVIPLAVSISVAIVIRRLLIDSTPVSRVANRLMVFGVTFGLGPVVISSIYTVPFASGSPSRYEEFLFNIFLIFLPIWPCSYLYVIYRHDMGTLRYRANRILGAYAFWATYLTAYLLFLISILDKGANDGLKIFGIFALLALTAVAPYCREWFQSFVDKRVFGIKYAPNEVVSAFARKIPIAYSREILKKVIIEDVLTTLMIRQSALYIFDRFFDPDDPADSFEEIYRQGMPSGESDTSSAVLRRLASDAGRYIGTEEGGVCSWVRLAILLSVQDKIVGVWLLGNRDPDDYYPKDDIDLLTNLANQIAPVIENFRLVEMARQEVEENKRLQQRLVHSQKMEAIGRFSAGIAHDFNNLLSVILGYSSLLMEKYKKENDIYQGLSEVHDAGKRAAGLTRQLLAFSRQSEMETKVMNINLVIEDIVNMLLRLTGEDIQVVTHLAPDLANARIDPGQMSQAIINLTVNARDAMPGGGRLAIRTANFQYNSDMMLSHADLAPEFTPGPYVLVKVDDTGTGLDPEIRSRIFEPFFTTKEMDKGTGLGLSMVYGFVKQIKGFIFADSIMGKGTTFSIYLPALGKDEAGVEDTPALEDTDLAGYETILLVEDEDSVRRVASEILEAHGYHVLQADSAREGLEVSDHQAGTIDLLLTDVVMPGMKGPELAGLLLDRRPGIKVLYMSGYNEEIFQTSSDVNAPTLIQKPFSPEKLARTIRQTLDSGNGDTHE